MLPRRNWRQNSLLQWEFGAGRRAHTHTRSRSRNNNKRWNYDEEANRKWDRRLCTARSVNSPSFQQKWIKHNKMRRFIIIMIIAIIICCYSACRIFSSLVFFFTRVDFMIFFSLLSPAYGILYFILFKKKSHIIQTVFCLDFLCVPFNLTWSCCCCLCLGLCLCGVACVCWCDVHCSLHF